MMRLIPLLPMRDLLLYSVGLFGLVASGVALLQGGGLPATAGFAASIAALIGNFIWLSGAPLTKEDLKHKAIDVLRNLAQSRNINNYSTLSKSDLIKALEKDIQSGKLTKRRWSLLKWGLLLAGLIAIPVINVLFPPIKIIPPKYSLAWYQNKDNRLSIVDPTKVGHELTADDIFNNHVRVPINLAIKNRDNAPLEVVRVELIYPVNIEVRSRGIAKIDPTKRKLIYEHHIGTLENVEEFTPLQSIDVIEVPFRFMKDRFITLLGDDVPMEVVTIIGEDLYSTKRLDLTFRVFCKDRPAVEGKIQIGLKSGVQVFYDLQEAKLREAELGDNALFDLNFPQAGIVSRWSASISPSGKVINYELLNTRDGYVQRVKVDNVIRRVAVDKNRDNYIDYIVIKGKDGSFKRVEFDHSWPLNDWRQGEVR